MTTSITTMQCQFTEEDLWSGIDRDAPEIVNHVATCPTCRERAALFRAGIEAIERAIPPLDPPVPEYIGSYAIRRRLGSGGMGVVYEGEQVSPRRMVAIKVVGGAPHVDEYRIRLLEREAQTLGLLRHPAIAAIYEASRTTEGQPFMAMELVQGLPLTEFARRNGLDITMRLALFRRVCDAIHYAHQRGVIHRDLKPSNILVDRSGDPKVLDFGLARITDTEAGVATFTQDAGRLMGTLAYMSPEEACGSPGGADVRSDVYSLGVILYELLTDVLPFTVSRNALPEAVRVISEEPPRRPSSINPALRGELDTIVLKALEKTPSRRYQSPAALSDDLGRFLTDQPIHARPASLLYRTRKLIVRHRFAFVIAGAVVGVLAGAAVWIQRFEREFQSLQSLNTLLQEQREALLELDLAKALQKLGDQNKSEQQYKSAIAALERSDRDDKVADARLGLAYLYLDRANPLDFEDAEQLLRRALRFFDQDPKTYLDERRRALEGLRFLYSSEVWNIPGALRDVEFELELIHHPVDASPLSLPPSG